MKSLLYLLGCLLFTTSAWGQTNNYQVLSAGGGTATDGTLFYSYTIGETVVGTDTSGLVIITRGFHQPETTVSLPIELLAFSAEMVNNNTVLDWATNQETNSDYFVIERSLDGRIFQKIGQVAAAGYSDVPTGYEYTDLNATDLRSPILHYRLSQYDMSGTMQLSPTVTVHVSGSQLAHSEVFPNPSSTEAFLRYQSDGSIQPKAILTTTKGQVLHTFSLTSGTGVQPIPVSELADGIYFVTFMSEGHRQTHRLLVSH